MSKLSLGAFGASRKERECRLSIHPDHFEHIPQELRRSIFMEERYGSRFGAKPEKLTELFAGVRTQLQTLRGL